MKVIFVTGNPGKIREIRKITADMPDTEVITAKEAGFECDIDENGSSFAENALIKVRAVGVQKDAVVMADDSGLCIDALDGGPGIYSSRYLGVDTPYPEKMQIIMDRMASCRGEERNAHYSCCIAILFPDGTEAVTEGIMEGRIAEKLSGENGFGYDPFFYVPEYGKTVGEIDDDVKNRISHRSKALEKAKTVLEAWRKAHE